MIVQSTKFPYRSHFYAASSEMMQPILWRNEPCVEGFVNVYRSWGRQYSQSTSYVYSTRDEAYEADWRQPRWYEYWRWRDTRVNMEDLR